MTHAINRDSTKTAIKALIERGWPKGLAASDIELAITAFLSAERARGVELRPIAAEQRSEQELRSTSDGWGYCEFCQARRHLPCRSEFDAQICPAPLDASQPPSHGGAG